MKPLRVRGGPARRWIYIISPFLSFLLLRYLFWPDAENPAAGDVLTGSSSATECPHLPGLDDVLVVMKTGVTESLEKVPVHFNTTLRCIPHYVIFSDFEENIGGVHIRDVLRNVDEDVKSTNPDFALYNRLRESGREALTTDDVTHDASTPFGKPDNPGWKLDKWKFLPMIDETLKIRPDAKWYVFIEADTYMIWPSLMTWLAKFNPKKPHYLGNQMQIEDVVFAHGGSGFVLSRPAMETVSEYLAPRVKEWDRFTDGHWAGDCVLGKAMNDAGVRLLWSWPLLHGSTPWEFDYFSLGYHKQPLCYPPMAYHHMTPDDIREMWEFERRWSEKHKQSVLLHHDVFDALIAPRIMRTQAEENWDNLCSDDSSTATASPADCEAECASNPKCMQYNYESGTCLTSTVAKRGNQKAGLTSGWMSDRIGAATKKLGKCRKPKWVLH